MSLGLLAPAALAALAALLLPLLIHLARHSELRAVEFAALRWLRAGRRPRRKPRIENWPLLLLRLLLLTLLALWLARPVLHGATDRTAYVAVMPGITAQDMQAQRLPANARLHWLATGFPSLDNAPPGPQPVASLLRQLDADLAQDVPLTVLATARFDGADAELPRLSRQVDWRILAVDPPAVPATLPPAPPPLRIHADDAHRSAVRYLRAVASAWQVKDAAPDDTNTLLAWLGKDPLPAAELEWVEAGGTALLADDAVVSADNWTPAWRDESGRTLFELRSAGHGRLLRFTLPLEPRAMPVLLDADFPQRLLDALQGAYPAPARADAHAYAPAAGDTRQRQPARDLQPWFALLVALAFAAERWLATRRGVEAPA